MTISALPVDCKANNTLIFSVDMNNGFCKEGILSSPRVAAIIPQTAVFLKQALAAGYRVVAFTDCHAPSAAEFAAYPPHCLAGTPESQLISELSFLTNSPLAEIIPKNSTNAFFALPSIKLNPFDHFIITGCCTDICVYQLAISLNAYFCHWDQGKTVSVVRSLVETYDGPGHDGDQWNNLFFQSMLNNGIRLLD